VQNHLTSLVEPKVSVTRAGIIAPQIRLPVTALMMVPVEGVGARASGGRPTTSWARSSRPRVEHHRPAEPRGLNRPGFTRERIR
jgi:hypothetical protein